jgi:phospholipid/cholesterol/gamma-HCH transport system permease protein
MNHQNPRLEPSPEEIRFSGDFTLSGARPETRDALAAVEKGNGTLRLLDEGIDSWDSTLMTVVMRIREEALRAERELDVSAMPEGVQRLLDLALAIPAREGAARKWRRKGILETIGLHAVTVAGEVTQGLSFLGETAVSVGRLVTGRARFRASDLWLQIEQCGPQALAITSLISVLVGAILAFVGAVQLQMFNAEVYVANLVGLGMVMEMGALMTGIILAGRTGAAFAAQLGTMQVNEEIDALKTLGIPPMDYLVLPRMLALALMTPLLVIYADVLGILGGAAVGVWMLEIPPQVFFVKTFEMMTPWLCIQGLIKGSTFGILVALAGCMRGMRCGRSASAVGQAATSAVVTSLILIVIADAVWTLIFMRTG